MRLEERKEYILDFVVRDYIRTTRPVSSGKINAKSGLRVGPATIRNSMLELDDEGFLYQPHTSAGRVPTKKGYKYFVDNLMTEQSIPSKIEENFEKIFSEFLGEKQFDELTSFMAHQLKLFSGILANGRVFKHGFVEVLREPEFKERDFLLEFAEFADNVEDNLNDFDGVNIGNFSVVSSVFGPRNIVFIAGPRRMDYEKALSIIKFITKNL